MNRKTDSGQYQRPSRRKWAFVFVAACLATLSALALGLLGCMSPRSFDERAWRERVAAEKPAQFHAPHRDADGIFFNPWLQQDKSFWDFWRWRLSANSRPEVADKEFPLPVEPNDGAYLKDPSQPPSITWVGHATYVFQLAGQVVVTDPLFSDYAAVVRRLAPPAFGPEAIPAGSVVLISHNHYDHLDADSVAALGGRCRFLCPLGLGDLLREMGARDVTELDWWQQVVIGPVTYTCLPAQHWSRRFGQGYNESLWCSWMVQGADRTIYYGADSGYAMLFKEIGRRFQGIDAALLGAGAYEPRWFMHYAHMDMAEILDAAADLGTKRLIPTQWGVLKLGDEPAAYPPVELEALAQKRGGVPFALDIMPVGGRIILDSPAK